MDPSLTLNKEFATKIRDVENKERKPKKGSLRKSLYRKVNVHQTIYHQHTQFRRVASESPLVSVQNIAQGKDHAFVLQSKRSVDFFMNEKKSILHSVTAGDLSCPIAIRPFAEKQVLTSDAIVYAIGSKDGKVHIHAGGQSFRSMFFPQEVSAISFLGFQNIAIAYGSSIEILDFVAREDVWSTHGGEVDEDSKKSSKRTKQLVPMVHEDRITSILQLGNLNEASIFATGSYDKHCILWDIRQSSSEAVVEKWSHDHPIECMIRGEENQIITGGGEYFKVWDIRNLSQGPLVERAAHQNTVTSLLYIEDEKVLVSSSLDQHLNIYDSSTGVYSLQHSINLSTPISDFAFSPDKKQLMVTSTGKHYFKSTAIEVKMSLLQKKHIDTSKEMWQGEVHPLWIEQLFRMSEEKENIIRSSHLFAKYRPLLDSWEYKKALTLIIGKEANNPMTVVAFIEYMRMKRYTHEALSNRNDVQLLPILQFVNRYIGDHKYVRVLIPFLRTILDIYGGVIGVSPPIDKEMRDIRRQLNESMKKLETLQKLKGVYSFFLSIHDCLENSESDQSATTRDILNKSIDNDDKNHSSVSIDKNNDMDVSGDTDESDDSDDSDDRVLLNRRIRSSVTSDLSETSSSSSDDDE